MKFKKIFEKVSGKKYIHKDGSSFTIKKIEDTYKTDKLKAEANFKVYAALFESSIEEEGSKTSNMSTTLMDKEAFNSNLKEGKYITVKGDPAEDDYKREVLKKDLSNVLSDIKELRSDYLNEKDKDDEELKGSYAKGLNKKEKEIAKREIKTTTKKSDSDPSAYDVWDSDKKYKKRGGKTKKSKHTKAYDKMYKKENINENKKALMKKSEETGVSYSILKQVYDRGMAAWKTGHRPGVVPHQWAMARVNSFLTGGKTQKTTDKDLWDKHKKNESELPFDEDKLNENTYIREFSKDLDFDELKWHWDDEDRTFEILEGEGWLFQRDNHTPIEMKVGDIIKIKKDEYHRAIKTDNVKSDLVIKLTKHK